MKAHELSQLNNELERLRKHRCPSPEFRSSLCTRCKSKTGSEKIEICRNNACDHHVLESTISALNDQLKEYEEKLSIITKENNELKRNFDLMEKTSRSNRVLMEELCRTRNALAKFEGFNILHENERRNSFDERNALNKYNSFNTSSKSTTLIMNSSSSCNSTSDPKKAKSECNYSDPLQTLQHQLIGMEQERDMLLEYIHSDFSKPNAAIINSNESPSALKLKRKVEGMVDMSSRFNSVEKEVNQRETSTQTDMFPSTSLTSSEEIGRLKRVMEEERNRWRETCERLESETEILHQKMKCGEEEVEQLLKLNAAMLKQVKCSQCELQRYVCMSVCIYICT